MDPAWLATLPEPLKTLLIGAAGDFAGSLASDVVGRLLDAAGYQVKKRFRPTPQQLALTETMAEALVVTISRQTTDPELMTHYLTLFGEWAARDAVVGELSQVIDPRPDAALDLELLAHEFEALGYDSALLGDEIDFEEMVAQFVANFYDAAGRRAELQGQIEIGLLRGIVQRADEQVRLLGRVADTLERQAEVTPQPRLTLQVQGDVIEADGPVATHGSAISTGSGSAYAVQGDLIQQFGDLSVDPTALRQAYLHRVFEQAGALSLAGVDRKTASEAEARLNLGAVYTALLTQAPETPERMIRAEMADVEQRRLSAVDQLNGHHRLVLLGDPGSGKSTFVNFVALCMAGEVLGDARANLALLTAPLPADDERRSERDRQKERPQLWDHGPLLPVRVVLRDFAARGLPAKGKRVNAEHLWRFITDELKAAALGDFVPHLKQELLERGGLLLLDGLDEVPEAEERRAQIRQVVADFAASFQSCRILVTSRTYAYQKQDWRLPGFAEAVLAPFSPGQIRRFVDRWYAHIGDLRHLNAADAQGRAELLKGAIFASDRLLVLAERPLLLTLMASLHAWRGGSLPEKREELYNDAVDLLLDWWESQRVVRDAAGAVLVIQPSLAEWLRVDRDLVRSLLNELAYKAHAGQAALVGTADVAEGELVAGLMRLSQNPDVNPAQLVEYLSTRAGLLVPRGVSVYTLPHRTFQEYLAACHLTDAGFPEEVAKLVLADGERWREVALLAGAKAARGAKTSVWNLAEEMCHRDVAEEPKPGQCLAALLAAQTLIENSALTQVSERNQPKADRIQRWLVAISQRGLLSPVDRVAAGDALAAMGDDRPGVGLRADGLPDIAPCEVPAGEFFMGSKDNSLAVFGQETPQQEISLGRFFISRYPITNAQYAAFVRDGGYTEKWRDCWTQAGWREKRDRTEPDKVGGVYDLPNHPAVLISWYEALAFCRWLSQKLGVEVALPTEAQWEKAARGVDARTYPWVGEITSDHANYLHTGIGTTSAVGVFPKGSSPYGALDMSGNVWEWCSTKWCEKYDIAADDDLADTDRRVLRGGSCDRGAGGVRCAYRNWCDPYYRLDDLGFRVVCVSPPIMPLDSEHSGLCEAPRSGLVL